MASEQSPKYAICGNSPARACRIKLETFLKILKAEPNRRPGILNTSLIRERPAMTQHILTSGKGLQCSRWLPAKEPVMTRHSLPAPCLKSLERGLLAGFSNFSYVFFARVHVWLSFSLLWIFALKDKMEIYLN